MPKTAIIGGGAAGFFLAVTLKEMMPEMSVTIFESGSKVLRKVAVSGGGRCNCTNTFEDVGDLKEVYPRGHRLMKRLMKGFSERDAYAWFERHGVRLTVQDDHCVFPQSQDSQTIINCFLHYCRRYGVEICTGMRIDALDALADYDYVCVTMGGQPRASGLQWLADTGHKIESPVPSLFTFNIEDAPLRSLMGTVTENTSVMIPGTSFRASGALLVTHWGMSGPAILRLSSYAARHLADCHYQSALSVNWTGRKENEVSGELLRLSVQYPQKTLGNVRPYDLPSRLWSHLLTKGMGEKAEKRWGELGKKDVNRLVNILTNDNYPISGRSHIRDEFVTCGGVALDSVNSNTLESRVRPHLYFAGEVLDIDGVTGGFNFQAAWTTAASVAAAIAAACKATDHQERPRAV